MYSASSSTVIVTATATSTSTSASASTSTTWIKRNTTATAVRASSIEDGGDTTSPSPLWMATRAVCEGDDVARAVQLVREAASASASASGGEMGSGSRDDAASSASASAPAASTASSLSLNAVGRDEEGSVEGTPLWLACLAARNGVPGAAGLAREMLAAGADPNVSGTQGIAGDASSPLWWAAAAVEAGATGALDLARELIAAGADVNAEGTYDVVRGPPLWWAAVAVRNGEEDAGVRLAQMLLDAGADASCRGNYGPGVVDQSPLVLAAQAVPELPGCARLCRVLLGRGARLESPELTSLLLYRVGSSIAAVKNLFGGFGGGGR